MQRCAALESSPPVLTFREPGNLIDRRLSVGCLRVVRHLTAACRCFRGPRCLARLTQTQTRLWLLSVLLKPPDWRCSRLPLCTGSGWRNGYGGSLQNISGGRVQAERRQESGADETKAGSSTCGLNTSTKTNADWFNGTTDGPDSTTTE